VDSNLRKDQQQGDILLPSFPALALDSERPDNSTSCSQSQVDVSSDLHSM